MFAHIERITGAAQGTQTQAVICEKCGTKFYYELTRVGIGDASAPYYMFRGAARRRAETGAQRKLEKRLASEAELVPCPKCRWVNEELVEKARNQLYCRAPWLMAVVIGIGLVGAIIVWSFLSTIYPRGSSIPAYVAAAVVCSFLLSPILILWTRRQLRRRLDPNRMYPNSPPPPPGTPPALVEATDPQTGHSYLQAAPAGTVENYRQGDWAILRPGQLVFPGVCCVCTENAQTAYKTPFTIDEDSEIHVPLCNVCFSRIRHKWWLVALGIGGVAIAAGYSLGLSMGGIDESGNWSTAIMIAVVGAVIGIAVIPHRLCRPYRMRIIDKDRGIIRFAAANPHFTELLIENARASDGVS